MMLITRPEYDTTTSYLSKLSESVILEASKKFGCIDLKGEKAKNKEFESFVKKKNPKLIFLNGHGNSKTVNGHGKGEKILELNKNENMTKSRIVYARACDSLKELGKSCVKKGARAYIGYKNKFIFPVDVHKTANPELDEIAKPCIEASNMIPISLIKGNNVQDSIERANQKSKKFIEYFMTHYNSESMAIISCLRWNMIIRKFHGNNLATI